MEVFPPKAGGLRAIQIEVSLSFQQEESQSGREEMDSRLSSNARRQLEKFCRQYLQLLREPDYPDSDLLRNGAFQQALYDRLFKDGAIIYGPPPRYQLQFLKELTRRIEQSIQNWEEDGVSDDIMNYMSFFLASAIPSEVTSAQQKSYVTYTLSSMNIEAQVAPSITLLETRNLLAAGGTTGFGTWDAALHLGNYLCQHSDMIRGKTILELGAGTGYVSILCTKIEADLVIATDGSDDVVAHLGENFFLNGIEDSSVIEAKELKWGQALIGSEHPEWNRGRKVDVVLGADITYDAYAFPALFATLGDLIDLYPEAIFIISVTIRNPATFDSFLERSKNANFTVEKIKFPIEAMKHQTGPFFSDQVHIQICILRKG